MKCTHKRSYKQYLQRKRIHIFKIICLNLICKVIALLIKNLPRFFFSYYIDCFNFSQKLTCLFQNLCCNQQVSFLEYRWGRIIVWIYFNNYWKTLETGIQLTWQCRASLFCADVTQKLITQSHIHTQTNTNLTFLKSEKPNGKVLAPDKSHFDALSLGRGSRGCEIDLSPFSWRHLPPPGCPAPDTGPTALTARPLEEAKAPYYSAQMPVSATRLRALSGSTGLFRLLSHSLLKSFGQFLDSITELEILIPKRYRLDRQAGVGRGRRPRT